MLFSCSTADLLVAVEDDVGTLLIASRGSIIARCASKSHHSYHPMLVWLCSAHARARRTPHYRRVVCLRFRSGLPPKGLTKRAVPVSMAGLLRPAAARSWNEVTLGKTANEIALPDLRVPIMLVRRGLLVISQHLVQLTSLVLPGPGASCGRRGRYSSSGIIRMCT